MAINVKYFGSSDIPAFERDFGSMEELVKENPFRPFGKENKVGPTGKAFELEKSNHATLKKLGWEDSGHRGDAGKYAGFDSQGNAALLDGGSQGEDAMGIYIDNGAGSIFVYGRRATLHSPGGAYVGATWDVSEGASFSMPIATTTYYFGFDPDGTSCGIVDNNTTYPISTRLYTVTIQYTGTEYIGTLSRVWNSGDIDIIAMWLDGLEA